MQFRLRDHDQFSDELRAVIERKARPIEHRLTHVDDALTSLDVTIARGRRDGTYVAKLVLTIPDRILAVSGDGPTAVGALGEAFDALAGRLDERAARRSRVPLIRRRQLAYRRPSAQPVREEAEIESLEEIEDLAAASAAAPAESPAGPPPREEGKR